MDKKFSILIATFNGEKFLQEQLDSLASQDEEHIDVLLSDQNSSDKTLEIARQAKKAWPKGNFEIISANVADLPQDTPEMELAARNFLVLIREVAEDADYFAFCDQDDVWDTDKLSRAREWLDTCNPDIPALFCSRTRLVDEEGKLLNLSPNFSRKPGFANAIVQNIAGGNTMVMNRAAIRLLKEASNGTSLVIHDWWAYLLISAVGGQIRFSPYPAISYRQHAGNIVGENMSLGAKWRRLKLVWSGRFKSWNDINRQALEKISDRHSPETKEILRDFDEARRMGGISGLAALRRSGIYRQTRFGQLSLYFACLIGKF